mmetsp:Transcript_15464/g.35887  ORF Transcript_15464/g.35887 Transcript_15464/m.35887 type:complete len:252 (+) Transcript_15464:306-1061(+)
MAAASGAPPPIAAAAMAALPAAAEAHNCVALSKSWRWSDASASSHMARSEPVESPPPAEPTTSSLDVDEFTDRVEVGESGGSSAEAPVGVVAVAVVAVAVAGGGGSGGSGSSSMSLMSNDPGWSTGGGVLGGRDAMKLAKKLSISHDGGRGRLAPPTPLPPPPPPLPPLPPPPSERIRLSNSICASSRVTNLAASSMLCARLASLDPSSTNANVIFCTASNASRSPTPSPPPPPRWFEGAVRCTTPGAVWR